MFGHLQIYSGYSFQQSTILIKDLVFAAKEKHLDALALTDKNNIFAAMEFSEACLKNNIKPIFGMEASVLIEGNIYPFIILAIDDQGYFDLVHICCEINLSPDRAIALDKLANYYQHLYIISGLEDGIVERHVAKEMEDEAIKYMRLFQELFHDHYYIMLQNHHLKLQEKLNERIMSLARYVKVKVICSNEVRYLKKQDALAVDLMQASLSGLVLEANYEPLTQEKYLKDEQEMKQLFSQEIIEETRHVLSTCKATIPLNEKYLPTYPVPHSGKAVDYLRSLCHVGLKKRFQNQQIPTV